MSQLIVISVIGTDRTGVVQDITKAVLACGGNIEESRMSTLGKEFAMLLLVSGNWHTLNRLEGALDKLSRGRQSHLFHPQDGDTGSKDDRMPYAVDVVALISRELFSISANFFSSRGHRNCRRSNTELCCSTHWLTHVRCADGH